MPTGGLAIPMRGLARIVPGRGTNFLHRTSRTSTDFSVWLVLNLGAGLGVGLGVGNAKENHPENQEVKRWVCWVSPTVCQCIGARVRVNVLTSIVRDYKSQYSKQLDYKSS